MDGSTMTTPTSFDEHSPDDDSSDSTISSPGTAAAKPFLALTAAAAVLGVRLRGRFDERLHQPPRPAGALRSTAPSSRARGAEIGESGCRTVMISPYSSMFRESLWGGLPISLLALAVFAYLMMHAARLLLSSKPFTQARCAISGGGGRAARAS